MNPYSFFSRLCHSPILRRAAVLLVALAWSRLAFGGEIHDAAKDGDQEKVKALLKDRPDLVNSKDDKSGATPLLWAAMKCHKDMVELLLANKADINATNKYGWTSLHLAGRKEVVEVLLAHGANVNARNNQGATPLTEAALMDQKDVVELLLANKADVNARDNRGMTSLHSAASFGSKDLAALLLANKADVNARDNRGLTPLHCAAFDGLARGDYKGVAELLLANKADVNATDKDGKTPLRTAVEKGNKAVEELLRQHGGHE